VTFLWSHKANRAMAMLGVAPAKEAVRPALSGLKDRKVGEYVSCPHFERVSDVANISLVLTLNCCFVRPLPPFPIHSRHGFCFEMIDILIPTYNRCTDLVKNLTVLSERVEKEKLHGNFRVLVSDNHSTDGTLRALDDKCQEVPFDLIVYSQKKMSG